MTTIEIIRRALSRRAAKASKRLDILESTFREYENSGSFAEAARKLGISGETCRRRVCKWERIQSNPDRLGARAASIINNLNLTQDPKSVAKWITENGQLELRRLRNCGTATALEIMEWCGILPDRFWTKDPHILHARTAACPHCGKRFEIRKLKIERIPL